jgi:hypothetical protein
MKITTKFLFFLMFLIPIISFGQEKTVSSETKKSLVEGTYQYEIIGRGEPIMPVNIAQIVEQNRHKTEVKYVQWGPTVRIKVLPEKDIKAAGFQPVSKFVTVESFNNK